ncbi:hypothetical protein EUX98_g1094 [Antrodiella citrinella]|uniref:Uncharacterized protein n=1 Tax=Antrodiella citrinella TaxID=2447956 RepID=A0A4S4N5E3_9APHY|nr:hypothetical protein EUX98_g1094 [Antrodiella citrinella]
MNRSIIKYHSGHAEVFFASSSRQALYRCNIVLAEVFGDFVLLIGASGEGQGLYESFVGSDWVFTVDKINHTVQWGPREVAKIHHSCAYFNSAKDVLEFSSTLIEVAGHVGRTARLTACSIATARQLLSSSVENQVSASIVDNIPVPCDLCKFSAQARDTKK